MVRKILSVLIAFLIGTSGLVWPYYGEVQREDYVILPAAYRAGYFVHSPVWVNLAPFISPSEAASKNIYNTEFARQLLSQDLRLKTLVSSVLEEILGIGSDFDTEGYFRVWIVPESVYPVVRFKLNCEGIDLSDETLSFVENWLNLSPEFYDLRSIIYSFYRGWADARKDKIGDLSSVDMDEKFAQSVKGLLASYADMRNGSDIVSGGISLPDLSATMPTSLEVKDGFELANMRFKEIELQKGEGDYLSARWIVDVLKDIGNRFSVIELNGVIRGDKKRRLPVFTGAIRRLLEHKGAYKNEFLGILKAWESRFEENKRFGLEIMRLLDSIRSVSPGLAMDLARRLLASAPGNRFRYTRFFIVSWMASKRNLASNMGRIPSGSLFDGIPLMTDSELKAIYSIIKDEALFKRYEDSFFRLPIAFSLGVAAAKARIKFRLLLDESAARYLVLGAFLGAHYFGKEDNLWDYMASEEMTVNGETPLQILISYLEVPPYEGEGLSQNIFFAPREKGVYMDGYFRDLGMALNFMFLKAPPSERAALLNRLLNNPAVLLMMADAENFNPKRLASRAIDRRLLSIWYSHFISKPIGVYDSIVKHVVRKSVLEGLIIESLEEELERDTPILGKDGFFSLMKRGMQGIPGTLILDLVYEARGSGFDRDSRERFFTMAFRDSELPLEIRLRAGVYLVDLLVNRGEKKDKINALWFEIMDLFENDRDYALDIIRSYSEHIFSNSIVYEEGLKDVYLFSFFTMFMPMELNAVTIEGIMKLLRAHFIFDYGYFANADYQVLFPQLIRSKSSRREMNSLYGPVFVLGHELGHNLSKFIISQRDKEETSLDEDNRYALLSELVADIAGLGLLFEVAPEGVDEFIDEYADIDAIKGLIYYKDASVYDFNRYILSRMRWLRKRGDLDKSLDLFYRVMGRWLSSGVPSGDANAFLEFYERLLGFSIDDYEKRDPVLFYLKALLTGKDVYAPEAGRSDSPGRGLSRRAFIKGIGLSLLSSAVGSEFNFRPVAYARILYDYAQDPRAAMRYAIALTRSVERFRKQGVSESEMALLRKDVVGVFRKYILPYVKASEARRLAAYLASKDARVGMELFRIMLEDADSRLLPARRDIEELLSLGQEICLAAETLIDASPQTRGKDVFWQKVKDIYNTMGISRYRQEYHEYFANPFWVMPVLMAYDYTLSYSERDYSVSLPEFFAYVIKEGYNIIGYAMAHNRPYRVSSLYPMGINSFTRLRPILYKKGYLPEGVEDYVIETQRVRKGAVEAFKKSLFRDYGGPFRSEYVALMAVLGLRGLHNDDMLRMISILDRKLHIGVDWYSLPEKSRVLLGYLAYCSPSRERKNILRYMSSLLKQENWEGRLLLNKAGLLDKRYRGRVSHKQMIKQALAAVAVYESVDRVFWNNLGARYASLTDKKQPRSGIDAAATMAMVGSVLTGDSGHPEGQVKGLVDEIARVVDSGQRMDNEEGGKSLSVIDKLSKAEFFDKLLPRLDRMLRDGNMEDAASIWEAVVSPVLGELVKIMVEAFEKKNLFVNASYPYNRSTVQGLILSLFGGGHSEALQRLAEADAYAALDYLRAMQDYNGVFQAISNLLKLNSELFQVSANATLMINSYSREQVDELVKQIKNSIDEIWKVAVYGLDSPYRLDGPFPSWLDRQTGWLYLSMPFGDRTAEYMRRLGFEEEAGYIERVEGVVYVNENGELDIRTFVQDTPLGQKVRLKARPHWFSVSEVANLLPKLYRKGIDVLFFVRDPESAKVAIVVGNSGSVAERREHGQGVFSLPDEFLSIQSLPVTSDLLEDLFQKADDLGIGREEAVYALLGELSLGSDFDWFYGKLMQLARLDNRIAGFLDSLSDAGRAIREQLQSSLNEAGGIFIQ